MCKRCNEIEVEMQAADEYGFSLTLAEYEAELAALQKRHAVEQKRALDVCPECFDTGYRRVSPTVLAKCSCKHGQRQ